MVAEQVHSGDTSTSTSTTESSASAMSKALALGTKLHDSNYTVWYASMITALLSLTGTNYEKLLQLLSGIKDKLTDSYDKIQDRLVLFFGVSDRSSLLTADICKEVNKLLFQAVFWTVDDTKLPSLKNHLATTLLLKGFETLKYVHDNYGPGSNTQQVCRAMDLMTERQNDGETAQEYGSRLQNMASSVTETIPDTMMKQIFIRGINSSDLRAFCIREMASTNLSFVQLLGKAREFDVQERVANNVDGFNAGVRRNNRNNNGTNRNNGPRNGRNDRNRNNNNVQGVCDFCNRPNHTWRTCFLLCTAKRPANANNERMDARRDELLEQCTPEKRRMYTEFMNRNNGNAAQAEAQLAFPQEAVQLAGQVAEMVPGGAQIHNALQAISLPPNVLSTVLVMMRKLFLSLFAMALSCGGLMILLGVLVQAVRRRVADHIRIRAGARMLTVHGV